MFTDSTLSHWPPDYRLDYSTGSTGNFRRWAGSSAGCQREASGDRKDLPRDRSDIDLDLDTGPGQTDLDHLDTPRLGSTAPDIGPGSPYPVDTQGLPDTVDRHTDLDRRPVDTDLERSSHERRSSHARSRSRGRLVDDSHPLCMDLALLVVAR